MRKIKPSPKIEFPCHCQDCTGTLFYVPTPKPDRKPRVTAKASYAQYKPRTRTLCDDCIRDIHERGQAVAPLPLPVRWRRRDVEGFITHLCDKHKSHRQERESA